MIHPNRKEIVEANCSVFVKPRHHVACTLFADRINLSDFKTNSALLRHDYYGISHSGDEENWITNSQRRKTENYRRKQLLNSHYGVKREANAMAGRPPFDVCHPESEDFKGYLERM